MSDFADSVLKGVQLIQQKRQAAAQLALQQQEHADTVKHYGDILAQNKQQFDAENAVRVANANRENIAAKVALAKLASDPEAIKTVGKLLPGQGNVETKQTDMPLPTGGTVPTRLPVQTTQAYTIPGITEPNGQPTVVQSPTALGQLQNVVRMAQLQRIADKPEIEKKIAERAPVAPHYTTTPDGRTLAITPNADGSFNTSQVYKADPKIETEVADLSINGKPHKVIVNKQTGEQIKDLGESGYRPPTVKIDNSDKKLKADSLKIFTPALDSAERFNIMSTNLKNAMKGDQQAMLSLLANHLGMTMGLQKGARITKDLYQEAEKSLPFLERAKAKFDDRGYLRGVVLSPPQMRQMLSLGEERFQEDLKKSRNAAKYLGVEDDGPERTANDDTMLYYLGQTAGDPEKARKLMEAAGWSIGGKK